MGEREPQKNSSEPNKLSPEMREVFEQTGYGCFAVETNIGIVHLCHASDRDIAGFAGKPTHYRWELIEMPTAPLIRLEAQILDDPLFPFRFESFLNAGDEDQMRVLDQLANQEELYLAFYGDDLTYRYTKSLEHGQDQWQQLDEMVARAQDYWQSLPSAQRDFDKAKAVFMLLS